MTGTHGPSHQDSLPSPTCLASYRPAQAEHSGRFSRGVACLGALRLPCRDLTILAPQR
jgi:hypothetical protein